MLCLLLLVFSVVASLCLYDNVYRKEFRGIVFLYFWYCCERFFRAVRISIFPALLVSVPLTLWLWIRCLAIYVIFSERLVLDIFIFQEMHSNWNPLTHPARSTGIFEAPYWNFFIALCFRIYLFSMFFGSIIKENVSSSSLLFNSVSWVLLFVCCPAITRYFHLIKYII